MSTIADLFPSWDLYRKRPADPVRLVLVADAAVEVWTSADAEVQHALKLGSSPDDATYVDLMLKASRRYFERLTGIALITQTWKAVLNAVPCANEVELARAPLQSLDEFRYLDVDNVDTAGDVDLDFALGNVGSATAFGRARLKDTATWPSIGTDPGALSFTFKAGFGDAASDVPEEYKTALLMLAANWYERRLPTSEGHIVTEFPNHLQSLIEMCRVADLV